MPKNRETLELQLQVSELKRETTGLRDIIHSLTKELKESNRLLRQQRFPPRPRCNSTEKQLIAASQKWRCAGLGENGPECPLITLNDGLFDSALFIIDHTIPWSKSGRNLNNRKALCPHCSSVKTRREIATNQHRRQEESEESEEEED